MADGRLKSAGGESARRKRRNRSAGEKVSPADFLGYLPTLIKGLEIGCFTSIRTDGLAHFQMWLHR
jgi:hypothetical protein